MPTCNKYLWPGFVGLDISILLPRPNLWVVSCMLQTCKWEGYLFLLDCWRMLPSSTYNSGLGSGGHSWLSARVPWLCSDFGFSWETSAGLGCDEMFWGGGLGRGHGWCPFSQAFWGGLVSQLRLCDSWTRVNLSGLVLCFRNWSLLLAIMIQWLE